MAQVISRARRHYISSFDTGRFLAILGGVLTTGVVVYLVAAYIAVPALRISRLTVQSDFSIDQTTLLAMAGLRGDEDFFSFDTDRVRTRLEEHYLVREAQVEKTFPNQATITLTRRRPLLAVVYGDETSGTRLGVVDDEGVLFSIPQGSVSTPILSGIVFERLEYGLELPEMVKPLLQDIHRLKMNSPELFSLFSEFEIVPLRSGDFDVRLFFKSYAVPVLIDGSLDRELCTYIVLVLDALDREGLTDSISELDFRAGEIVYRLKEAEIVE